MEVEMEGSFASFVENMGTLSRLAIIGLIGTFKELILISNNRISHSNKEVIKLVKIKASAILTPSNTLHQDGYDLSCHISRHATSSVTASAALPSHRAMSIITNSAASFCELKFCYSQLNLPPKCITLIIL
ncbi:hypothetical protein ACOSP7_017036 [Xanthoceras sorbifolium]